MQLAFRSARAPDELVDHFLRQPRHRAFPGFGQEIDIKPLGRGDCVHLHLAEEREADRAAIGIAARGADIIGRVDVQPLDSKRNRFVEADDDDRAGDPCGRFDGLVELEHQPQEAAVVDGFDFTLDGLISPGRTQRCKREQRQSLQKDHNKYKRTPGRREPQSRRSAGKDPLQPEWQSRHKAVPAGGPAGPLTA